MLPLDFIRKNKEKVILAAKNKNRKVDIDKILQLDDQKKELIHKIQSLREERNSIAQKDADKSIRERGKKIKGELKKLEEQFDSLKLELNNLLSQVPNIPLDEVPVGANSLANLEIKKWGKLPKFDFSPKSHLDLGLSCDILDLERGAKVSGFRGYFLKNEVAVLHFALLFYAFNKLVKKGYIPLAAPSIVKGFTLFGSGQFPWGEQEVYKLNDEDAYLTGTAEVPVTAYFSKEILTEKQLPKKFAAISSCFRREAGSYGKDTKGLYRLHEFLKVEQVVIAPNNLEAAKKLHQELQNNTEEIMQELKIPYRVMLMATGEMGEPQIKKYDTEAYMPYRQDFGEVGSNSIMGDFQARRLDIKYRKKDGTTEYCFTLNNTMIASPRILIAILENYQQKDGSILIPEVLKPLAGFDKISPVK